jgi:outer membrane protein OmpA-like peptidoglycan-associated protein
MKTLILSITAALLFISINANSQPSRIGYADEFFDKKAYSKAVEMYIAIYDKGDNSTQTIRKIGECYRYMNQVVKAKEWYGKLMNTNEYQLEDVQEYVSLLKSTGDYEAADTWLRKYYEMSQGSADGVIEFEESLADLMVQREYYNVDYLAINSPNSDFGAAFYKDRVVFASARNEGNTSGIYEWNNQPFLDLYMCRVDEEGDLGFLNKFSDKLNTDFHESSTVFSKDGNEIYFTRNSYHKGRIHKSSKGEVNLKIYYSKKKDGDWTKETPLSFNSNSYSCGHPSLSHDGTVMYFASDMPGGYGGTDIYFSKKLGNFWTKPENAGPVINTEGNETFPFVTNDGDLYFASDGHPGLGSLDIFLAQKQGKSFFEPVNVGLPINSSMDDFALIIDDEGKKGYFTSNRFSDGSDDNLYKFSISDFIFKGVVFNKQSKEILPGTTVILLDENLEKVDETTTNEKGEYKFVIDPDLKYTMISSAKYYYKDSYDVEFDQRPEQPLYEKEVYLEPKLYSGKGIVTHKEKLNPLEDVKITLVDVQTGTEKEFVTKDEGLFGFELTPESNYEIRFEKEGFFKKSSYFTTFNVEPGVMDLSEMLNEIIKDKPIRLDNIYYDYGKYDIRDDAAVELDKLVKILEDNPEISIELSAHTDARGSSSFNKKLSDKRAKSAAKYIVSKGISEDRITGKGYGEEKLLNKCADGVNCSEEDHQYNRRTEFKVTKIQQ